MSAPVAASIAVAPLNNREKGDRQRFIRLANRIYREDPHWVATLDSEMHHVLGPMNPFYQHAEIQLWVVTRDGVDVGRIAGVADRSHNDQHGERTTFFGFFECLPDFEASAALFDAVIRWARERGSDRLRGPMNPSINDECGLLVDGYDSPPVLMMTYNPPYYADLVASSGLTRAKDLFAFQIAVAEAPARRLQRFRDKFAARNPRVSLRAITIKSLPLDVPQIKKVYNLAWEKNWGSVPMTDAEIDFMVMRLKPLLINGLAWLAEEGGEPAGFLLALPDLNSVLKPLKGRLLSSGLFRALPYLLGWRRPPIMRLVALGVRPEFQGRGIESAMLALTLETCQREGFVECEASWTLEDNVAVHRLIELFGGRHYKTYRIYDREILAANPMALGLIPPVSAD